MENLQIVTLTHKNTSLELIGQLHIDDDRRPTFLSELKEKLEVSELAYLSTCNRVEFIFNTESYFCKGRQHQLLESFSIDGQEKATLLNNFITYRGEEALRHLLEVGASLDSMVLGEREIITQVRTAFENARRWKISGDLLRLVAKKVIETSKRVYTETNIATRPVSVVSLAWKNFLHRQHAKNTPILLIGAGQTNANFARFLSKSGYTQVTIANRTLARAEQVASLGNWKAVQLFHIPAENFKVIISCTGSEEPIITDDFISLSTHESIEIIDMALPADTAENVRKSAHVNYLGMNELQKEAIKNLEVRKGEIEKCRLILDQALEDFRLLLRQREIELAMRDIPEKIRQIKDTAMGEVFAKELDQMDEASKELLTKILTYMEKKYISVPMKLARQVIIENSTRN